MQKMFFSRQEQNNGAFALPSSEVVGETSSEDVSAIINYYILRETISNMQLRLIGQC